MISGRLTSLWYFNFEVFKVKFDDGVCKWDLVANLVGNNYLINIW